jgi:hypothetical protein
MGQHIGSAERDHAERHAGPGEAVRHLGDGAVPSGGDDEPGAACDGLARELRRMPAMAGLGHLKPDAVVDQKVEHPPEALRAPPPGGRVEDDQHADSTPRRIATHNHKIPVSRRDVARE